jgi:hypothetical protein
MLESESECMSRMHKGEGMEKERLKETGEVRQARLALRHRNGWVVDHNVKGFDGQSTGVMANEAYEEGERLIEK